MCVWQQQYHPRVRNGLFFQKCTNFHKRKSKFPSLLKCMEGSRASVSLVLTNRSAFSVVKLLWISITFFHILLIRIYNSKYLRNLPKIFSHGGTKPHLFVHSSAISEVLACYKKCPVRTKYAARYMYAMYRLMNHTLDGTYKTTSPFKLIGTLCRMFVLLAIEKVFAWWNKCQAN